MEDPKIWTSVLTGEPPPLLGPKLTPPELKEGNLWPYPPEWIVRFVSKDSTYVVDVEVALSDGVPYLTGIAVRAGLPTSPTGTPDDPWLEEGSYDPVVVRDVQRMPLATYAKAALAKVRDPLTEEGRQEVRRILMPRRRPERGHGPDFYKEILRIAGELEVRGVPPVAEIARRYQVSTNVVHQWVYRARHPEAKRPAADTDQGGHARRDGGSSGEDARG